MARFVSGFGAKGIGTDRSSNKFKAKAGVQYVCKPVMPFAAYLSHKVEHPTKRKPNGEPVGFSIICGKEWVPESADDPNNGLGAWEGECLACDQGHQVEERYAMGWLILAEKHERTNWSQVSAEHCVQILDFPDGRARDLKKLDEQEGLNGGGLGGVEILVQLDNKPDAEMFNKWTPIVSKHPTQLTQEHLDAWDARGPQMLEDHVRAPSMAEQMRRLKFDSAPQAAPGPGPAPQYRAAPPQTVADDPALATLPVVPARTPVTRAPAAAVKPAAVVGQPRAVAPKAPAPAAAPKAAPVAKAPAAAPAAAKPVAKAPAKAPAKVAPAAPPPPSAEDDQAAVEELLAEVNTGVAGAETVEGEPVF